MQRFAQCSQKTFAKPLRNNRMEPIVAEALSAVLEAVEDDVARLAYADLLVQRGDPRGSFIRAHCALSGADITHSERLALRKTCDDLLKKHEASWFENAGLPKDTEVAWSRGFIDRVTLGGEHFAGDVGKQLFAIEPIRAATLKINSERVAKLVGKSTHFAKLKELSLRGAFGDDSVEALFTYATTENLRVLNVGGSKMSSNGFLYVTSELQTLERLSVTGCSLQGDFAQAFTDQWKLSSLNTLYATRTGMDDEDLLSIVNHYALSGLTTLTIADNEYGERAILALLNSPSIAALRMLELDLGDSPSPIILEALLNSTHLLSIRGLRLSTRRWMIDRATVSKLNSKYGRGLKWL